MKSSFLSKLSITKADINFIATTFVVSSIVLYFIISAMGGIALGAPAMQLIATLLWLTGISVTTFIAYTSTRWAKAEPMTARRGAQAGARTVAISAGIVILISVFIFREFLFFPPVLLGIIVSCGISVGIGAVLGALIYSD